MANDPPHRVNYMMGHHPSVLKAHGNRTAAVYAAYLLHSIRPNDLILDVGCGPGTITVGLAERAPNGWTFGIDYSAVVIKAAKKNAEENGGPKNCEFKTGNAYALDWDEGSFDVVHAHQCLIHLDDPVKAFKEMRRVCKVGGIVGVKEGNGAVIVTIYFVLVVLTVIRRLWGLYHVPRRSAVIPNAGHISKGDVCRWQ
jgi:ubiquinone/menaquinone biosynthesis C-methylase UbiE